MSVAYGQNSYRITGFAMSIKGTSNLHDWESYVKEVRANGSILAVGNQLKSIQSLTVEIPTKTIKSPKGSIMDNKTYDALLANTYPNITFKLDKINSMNIRGDAYDINASGYLTLAGATNRIDLQVVANAGADGSFSFSGSKKIKMTDYKVNPPTALLGTLTTGNEVEVVFKVVLVKN
jgi:polyisoprenoid-binding protein YceI